jgi:hypothetical protein
MVIFYLGLVPVYRDVASRARMVWLGGTVQVRRSGECGERERESSGREMERARAGIL